MLAFDNPAAIAGAPSTPGLDPVITQLLKDRVHDWAATDLLGLTHVLVVQLGDSEQTILDEIPFSPLTNSMNDSRFGSPDFEPPFDWLSTHDGWAEIIATVSNDGFAFHLFIELAPDADPDLLALVRAYEHMNEDEHHG
jgi:hypothetical protein